jgi:hypothetical protein
MLGQSSLKRLEESRCPKARIRAIRVSGKPAFLVSWLFGFAVCTANRGMTMADGIGLPLCRLGVLTRFPGFGISCFHGFRVSTRGCRLIKNNPPIASACSGVHFRAAMVAPRRGNRRCPFAAFPDHKASGFLPFGLARFTDNTATTWPWQQCYPVSRKHASGKEGRVDEMAFVAFAQVRGLEQNDDGEVRPRKAPSSRGMAMARGIGFPVCRAAALARFPGFGTPCLHGFPASGFGLPR